MRITGKEKLHVIMIRQPFSDGHFTEVKVFNKAYKMHLRSG